MNYLNKLLFAVKNDAEIFRKPDINYRLGLTASQVKELKKEAITKGFILLSKHNFYLSESGELYLKENPIISWCNNEFPNRPEINQEYLKLDKMPPILTKAIRNIEKHFINNEEIKENSIEYNILKELLEDNSTCKNISNEIQEYILQDGKIELNSVYNKFLSDGLTKSIIAILLFNAIIKNKDKLAIYEKGLFQLKLDCLMLDRMLYCPQNFVIQKTITENIPILEDISELLLPFRTNNILDITKGLIFFIRNLDKYTLKTERLSKKTLRFRNIIMNAKDPIILLTRDIPKILENKLLIQCDKQFLNAFETALNELQFASSKLTDEIKTFLLDSFNSKSRQELTSRFKNIQEYIGYKELKVLLNNIIDEESDDNLWIKRIATFINKERVPKDWNDNDIADYKFKVKELALKFQILESTTGSFELIQSSKFDVLLEKIKELNSAEKNILLRKIVNN